jgi:hypothetical protein
VAIFTGPPMKSTLEPPLTVLNNIRPLTTTDTARLVVFQCWRTTQGRAQLHRISIAQGDATDPAVMPEHAIGGCKVLQHPIAVLESVLFDKGMDPAHALDVCPELTARIAANAHPSLAQFDPSCELLALPDLKPAVALPSHSPNPPEPALPFGPAGGNQTLPITGKLMNELSHRQLGRSLP